MVGGLIIYDIERLRLKGLKDFVIVGFIDYFKTDHES